MTLQSKNGPQQGIVYANRVKGLTYWQTSLDQFNTANASATQGQNGVVSSTKQTTVGSMPAYESLSTFGSGTSNAVNLAMLEVREPNSVLLIYVGVPVADTSVATAILNSAKA